jgi:hypothetical protein
LIREGCVYPILSLLLASIWPVERRFLEQAGRGKVHLSILFELWIIKTLAERRPLTK